MLQQKLERPPLMLSCLSIRTAANTQKWVTESLIQKWGIFVSDVFLDFICINLLISFVFGTYIVVRLNGLSHLYCLSIDVARSLMESQKLAIGAYCMSYLPHCLFLHVGSDWLDHANIDFHSFFISLMLDKTFFTIY